jgi:hypothetical protein
LRHGWDGFIENNKALGMIMALLGWAPSIRLAGGLKKTYEWIKAEFLARAAAEGTSSDSL